MIDLEYRDLRGLEVREEGESRQLVGYAAVFNSITDLGWFREQVSPGAFSRSLKEHPDVRALVDHDSGRVIGRSKSGTLRLSEDARGLRAEIDIADTTDGRDIMELVRRGDVDGMSFGFRPVSTRWDDAKDATETDLRTLLDVDLYEVSIVAFPAYPATSIAARSAERVYQETRGADRVKVWQRVIGSYRSLL